MVGEARKAQAAEQGAREVARFWGDIDPERARLAAAEIEARLLDGPEPPDLLALLTERSTEYAGGLGLDAILHDLAARGVSAEGLDSFLKDLWRSRAAEADAARAGDAGNERE